jgi:hypothetical protein
MPTLAVFTGGGWHLYWLFREPWFFEPGSDPRFHDRDVFCSLLRRWQKLIRDTAASMNLALDPTADPERILRPAGTIRAKDGCESNATSFFDELSSGRRYSQADMTELLDMLGVVDQHDYTNDAPADVGIISVNPRATRPGAGPDLEPAKAPGAESDTERRLQRTGYAACRIPRLLGEIRRAANCGLVSGFPAGKGQA